MFLKALLSILFVAFVVDGLVQVDNTSAIANVISNTTMTCTEVNVDEEYDLSRDNLGYNAEFHAYRITDGAGTVLYYWPFYDDELPYHAHTVWTDPYTALPQYNPLTFVHISFAGNGLPEEITFLQQYNCPGLPFAASATGDSTVPGPDMVDMPSTAVVGVVVANTPIYFAPQMSAATDNVIEAGKSLWVVERYGDFYKVMLSGQFFYLPVNAMRPNFDDVWNGAPLPG